MSANETTFHPSQFYKFYNIKGKHYRSRNGLQHGALAHTEQQAMKGPKILLV